ncbi:MAG: DUF1553 domain-containing protein, partial [Candidatus Saccharimonas sp.]|nr:DUF1553 domain-containing protein [Planctomycetaceae bacterium]
MLVKLQERGLSLSPPADRRALLRRATFDLIGLPPTPEDVEEFVNDPAPDAFDRVVERLLESPHYGERWGRHWLDLARYVDDVVPNPAVPPIYLYNWQYRDWVVSALNRDLPFDRFVQQQIAGDLMPELATEPFNADGLTATGVLGIGEWSQLDGDRKRVVCDLVDDQIRFVSRVFMGVSVGCARCHDHKFDPITNHDYYALAGMFFSTRVVDTVGGFGAQPKMLVVPIDDPVVVDKRRDWERQVAELTAIVTKLKSDAAAATSDETKAPIQAELTLKEANLALLNAAPAPDFLATHAAQDGGHPDTEWNTISDTRVQIRGSYARLGDVVPRRLPTVFAGESQAPLTQGSGRRQLAEWLARPDHPLTSRVMVNRIWLYHFGEGLVRTPGNFGKLGRAPSHPELLDWLAVTFVESGWSIKAMHRLLMSSAAYQQSSRGSEETRKADPENVLLSRFPRRRLEVEALRDSLLAVSGTLDRTLGGPATLEAQHQRRMLYMHRYRQSEPTIGGIRQTFDAPDPKDTADQRNESTVAPQALYLMNSPFVLQQAERLAERTNAAAETDAARIDWLFRTVLARP